MKAATPLELLTEKEWASQVAALARALNFKRYHTFRSVKSPAGFPDEVLVRDRIVFLELKTEQGKLSDAQREWLAALIQAGAETYVARPRDLQALADALQTAGRGDLLAARTRAELHIPAC